jgi:hypothetical protein
VKIKLGRGGKPLIVGGKVVTNCDCCGGEVTCVSGEMQVVFSDIVLDCGCQDIGTGSTIWTDAGGINGTFCLTGTSPNWSLLVPRAGRLDYQLWVPNTNCTGPTDSYLEADLQISLYADGSAWEVYYLWGSHEIFDAHGSGALPAAAQSNITLCNVNNVAYGIAHGGTATCLLIP